MTISFFSKPELISTRFSYNLEIRWQKSYHTLYHASALDLLLNQSIDSASENAKSVAGV